MVHVFGNLNVITVHSGGIQTMSIWLILWIFYDIYTQAFS